MEDHLLKLLTSKKHIKESNNVNIHSMNKFMYLIMLRI